MITSFQRTLSSLTNQSSLRLGNSAVSQIATAAKILFWALLLGAVAIRAAAVQPKAEGVAAFDRYVARTEAEIEQRQRSPESFLAILSGTESRRTEVEARLRRGEVVIERRGKSATEVPGGLIHHWTGIAFIPGAKLPQLFGIVQDYDHLTRSYRPEVEGSKLVARNGDDFQISMRLRKHKVITVVLDTEYDVHYGRLDAEHQFSLSRSTRVAEIANKGEANEHPLPTGEDHGFMWRLNSYWRFVQLPDGLLVECEAVSLSRDVPTGLKWLIGPFVQDIPKESLQFTLRATRDAVLASAPTNRSSLGTGGTRQQTKQSGTK